MMATNYEVLIETMREFPRCHVSIHGVTSLNAAVNIIDHITGEDAEVRTQDTAFAVHGKLDGGGDVVVFVPHEGRPV
jgi:hypothetical protein